MHFLIVTLMGAVLEQIPIWARKYFREEIRKKEETIASELWDLFGWSPPVSPVGRQLSTLVNRFEGEGKKTRGKKTTSCSLYRENLSMVISARESWLRPANLFGADYRFCEIDNFTSSSMTIRIRKSQKLCKANLNRLVMHRNPHVFFKLSTESPVSFARDDVDGKHYVESREYDLLNLGLRYIDSDPNQTLEFLEDLFERRFREVKNYPIKHLTELVGLDTEKRKRNRTSFSRTPR